MPTILDQHAHTFMIIMTIIINITTIHTRPTVCMCTPITIMSILTIVMRVPVTIKSTHAHCN